MKTILLEIEVADDANPNDVMMFLEDASYDHSTKCVAKDEEFALFGTYKPNIYVVDKRSCRNCQQEL